MWFPIGDTNLLINLQFVNLAEHYINMKILNYIFGSVLLAVLVSCVKPESERMPEVFQITARGADKLSPFNAEISVFVSCDFHWNAELEDASWGSINIKYLNEGKGGEFIVKLNDNLGEEDRKNTLTVKAGKGVKTLEFVQPGMAKFFRPNHINLEGTKESSVIFTAPDKWKAELPENPDWLMLTSASGNAGNSRLACRANDENENLGSRETFIRLSFGKYSFDIPVFQGQKDVILTEDTKFELGCDAQEFSVRTQFNVDYEVDIPVSWIKCITTKSQLNEGIARFEVEENTSEEKRSGAIAFKGGKADALILVVEQKGKDRILNFNQQGVYGLDGMDYIWGEEGWNQRSLLLSPDGSYRFRLLGGSILSAVELCGLRFDYPAGEEQQLQLRIRNRSFVPFYKDCSVVLLKQEDDLYWFKDVSGPGFIIKK